LSRTSDSWIGPLRLRSIASRFESCGHQLGAEKSFWIDRGGQRVLFPKLARKDTERPDELPEAGITIPPSVKAKRSHFFTVDLRVVDLEPVDDFPGFLVCFEDELEREDSDPARFHGLDDDHTIVAVNLNPEGDTGV
jgi:hypothetical protein